jgi:hypothetical protein
MLDGIGNRERDIYKPGLSLHHNNVTQKNAITTKKHE